MVILIPKTLAERVLLANEETVLQDKTKRKLKLEDAVEWK